MALSMSTKQPGNRPRSGPISSKQRPSASATVTSAAPLTYRSRSRQKDFGTKRQQPSTVQPFRSTSRGKSKASNHGTGGKYRSK